MIKILHNATIYTQNPEQPIAAAIAIDGNRIALVGNNLQAMAEVRKGQNVEIIDLAGRAVIPGLIDAHIHLEQYSLGLQNIDAETNSRQECIQRVAERVIRTPPGQWILGHGWNQNTWPEGYGNAATLDAVAPNNPVYLSSKSLHSAWANSAALAAANIHNTTPDPPDGQIVRDSHGNPNGILLETAVELVKVAIPEPTTAQVEHAIRGALPLLAKLGLTGLHDFDRRRCFYALQSLHQRGELSLRVVKSIPLEDLSHAIAVGLRTGFGDDLLRIGGLKAFADGALGPQTAAMLQPYEGETENRGMLMLDGEELYERGRQAVAAGFSLAVHAIGDRANHEVLNAFMQLRKYENKLKGGEDGKTQRLRHRIEHVQLIHPDDAGRLAASGIVASMQPIHATSDMDMADRYWGKRSAFAYAWRTQLQHGAMLAFGSDAPVESPNPFWGLHAAVTRRRADGSPGTDGWYAAQRLSIQEALAGYTLGPAYLAGMEDRLGRLAPGYLADLLVLSTDMFMCPSDEIKEIHPVATMLGGQWIFNGLD